MDIKQSLAHKRSDKNVRMDKGKGGRHPKRHRGEQRVNADPSQLLGYQVSAGGPSKSLTSQAHSNSANYHGSDVYFGRRRVSVVSFS